MQIFIVGAGAIGTLYAAKLAAEHAVTLVPHRREHADAIRSGGVRVTGLEDMTARVTAATEIDAIGPGALVLLTTKVYASAEALQPVAPLVRPDTVVVCLQNGLDSERIVKDIVSGRCTVLRGITNFGAIFAGPGLVDLKARGNTLIEDGPAGGALAEMFTRCHLEGRVCADMRREVWKKLIVNCVINPLTGMTGQEVGWIAQPGLDPLKQRIIDECLAVAGREGVAFDLDFLRMLNETYGPSRNRSSMSQDLSSGRATEIDYMNGAVVDRGRCHGLACPVNAGLVAIIKAMERASAR